MALEWRTVNMLELEPTFRSDIEELLSKSKWDWYITHGHRSSETQNSLFGQGRSVIQLARFGLEKYARPDLPKVTNARAGQSAHNFGLAVDVALDGDDVRPGLQPLWDINHAAWLWLIASVKMHKRLRSGMHWNDWPHIERFKWHRYLHWQSNMDPHLVSFS
jgi:hypothetical protein